MWLLLLLFSTLSGPNFGTVEGIVDGDTLILNARDHRVVVRLFGVDAPEMGQKGYEESKSFLEEYIGSQARISFLEYDFFGRAICDLEIGEVDLVEEILKRGHGWYQKGFFENRDLELLEEMARNERLGIWKENAQMPPWLFRFFQYKQGGTPPEFSDLGIAIRGDRVTYPKVQLEPSLIFSDDPTEWLKIENINDKSLDQYASSNKSKWESQTRKYLETYNRTTPRENNSGYSESKGNYSQRSSSRPPLDMSREVKVRGHYRKLKGGGRTWVRPHTRSRPHRKGQ